MRWEDNDVFVVRVSYPWITLALTTTGWSRVATVMDLFL